MKGETIRMIENNRATLSGEIVSNFEFNHEVFGGGFYTVMLASERTSGQKDIIPIMVSDRLADVKADWTGRFVNVSGQFRSYNKHEGEKNHLQLSVFAWEFEEFEPPMSIKIKNSIFLDGYICKQPIYRKTPGKEIDGIKYEGREIADIILAVNRPYGKSDYIPLIFWGRNARYVSSLSVGQRLKIEGRIQSREYIKRISETESESRIAYEVSASKVEVLGRVTEDEQSED